MVDERKIQDVDRYPERGAIVLVVAVALPVIMIMAALVIDLGHLFAIRTQLQATADASALAAVSQLPNTTGVALEASKYADLNYPGQAVVSPGDVVVGRWQGGVFTPQGDPDYPTGSALNAVRVKASRSTANGTPVPLFFGGFVGKQSSDVSASSVATMIPAGGSAQGCVWALGTTGTRLRIRNNSTVMDGPDCDIHVNSSAPHAMDVNSGGSINAKSINIVGGYSFSGGGTMMPNPPTTGLSANPDPLASSLSPPSNVSAPCGTFPYGSAAAVNPNSGTTTLYPGVYCGGIGARSGATVNLMPGTYVVRGGDLGGGANVRSQNNGTTFSGSGVTFYLTCSAGPCTPSGTEKYKMDFQSGTTVNLSAPTSGAYKGILFYQDPNLKGQSDSDANNFHSGSTSAYDGVFYFPTQWLRFHSGSSSSASSRVILIAHDVHLHSAASVRFNALPSSLPDALAGEGSVQLVQ